MRLRSTPADITERAGALQAIKHYQKNLSSCSSVLVDGSYTGQPFVHEVKTLLGATVQVAKRSELRSFAVMPKRWVVERTFAWLEKCRRLWKNPERKFNTRLQFIVLAHLGHVAEKIMNRLLELFLELYVKITSERIRSFRIVTFCSVSEGWRSVENIVHPKNKFRVS